MPLLRSKGLVGAVTAVPLNARPRVLFLSNYLPGHVVSARGRFFAEALTDWAESRIEYRRGNRSETMRQFHAAVKEYQPSLIYTLDGLAAEVTAFRARYLYRIPYIIDGSATYEDYYWLVGASTFYRWAGRLWDHVLLGSAAALACRGVIQRIVFEARHYNRRIVHLSEGADLEKWVPKDGEPMRRRHNVNDGVVIGVIGSVAWSEQFQWAYGKEVIEVLRILRDYPLYGVLLPSLTSEPSALERLERLARDYGVESRLRVIRDIPREEVPDYLAMMDVCISTQLPSVIAEMRTTGKLPDYVACGKFVLATRVGDARLYLPEEMLVDYVDAEDYYQQLAQRIACLCANRERLTLGRHMVEIARRHFDYRQIALQARRLIESVLDRAPVANLSV